MRLGGVTTLLVSTLTLTLTFGLSPGDIGDVTTPPSGCALCASSGDCSHAFRDGPGQFCGVWMDRASHELPCCCPLNAVCNVSPADYVCTCAYVGAMPPYHSESDLMNRVLWMWWVLGMLVVVAVCGGCDYSAVKRLASSSGGDDTCTFVPPAMTMPLVSPTREALYGSTGQTSVVTFTPEAEEAEAGAGVGAATAGAAALGAAAGLLGGVTLASHDAPADDLDVAGDGFDGGLGSLEKVEEAGEEEGDEDDEDEEEAALLTVPGSE